MPEMAAEWQVEPQTQAAGLRTAKAVADQYAACLLRLAEDSFCAVAPISASSTLRGQRVLAAVPRRAITGPPTAPVGAQPLVRLTAQNSDELEDFPIVEAWLVVLDSEVLEP